MEIELVVIFLAALTWWVIGVEVRIKSIKDDLDGNIHCKR